MLEISATDGWRGAHAAATIGVLARSGWTSTAPVVTGTAPVERYAYANPIWIRPTVIPIGAPTDTTTGAATVTR